MSHISLRAIGKAAAAICLAVAMSGVAMAGDAPDRVVMQSPAKDAAVLAKMQGLVNNRKAKTLSGLSRTINDGVVIRKSTIKDGKIIIPPSGLYITVRSTNWHPFDNEPLTLAGKTYHAITDRYVRDVIRNVTMKKGQVLPSNANKSRGWELSSVENDTYGIEGGNSAVFKIVKTTGNYYGSQFPVYTGAQISNAAADGSLVKGSKDPEGHTVPTAENGLSEMIYGIHAVQALLERAPERFQEVFILKGREDKRLLPLIHALESQGVVIQLANRQYLDEKSDGAVHQGIIARVKPGRQYQENDLPDLIASLDQPFLLILDGVTDPHNLGACLRSADAAGVHAVIVPKDRSAQLNATAKKVACGAAESVPLIRVTNLARTMRMLQEENIWIVGTAGEADHTLYQSKMTGRLALVMGAEGEGMRRLTREHCDELISIPMAGSVSSLNVSVATGICLFEAVRQRS